MNIRNITLILAVTFTLSCGKNINNVMNNYAVKTDGGFVNVIIEIPAGTSEKWEINKSNGKLSLEYIDNSPRVIKYLPYPFNYGMIPNTLLPKEEGGDGDPLDVIVIGDYIKRGSVVSAKVIGYIKMIDKGERDDKIITISKDSPLYFVNDINQLNQNFPGITKIIETWFKNYKGKNKIEIKGFSDKREAHELINKSIIK
jgi:inorganic pyrophosphatase